MADLPPSGPPPPNVPDGWKAVWNAQYSEWFYVNTHTKASQWEKPLAPAPDPKNDTAPLGPPPTYSATSASASGALSPGRDEKSNPNNPYNTSTAARSPNDVDADARYAAQLQAEENARAAGRPTSRGAADSYYSQSPGSNNSYGQTSPQAYPPQQSPPPQAAGKERGLLGRLMGRHSNNQPPPQGYPQQGYSPQGYQQGYPPQGYGGGYGGPPPGGYGGYPPPGGYGGYPPQQYQEPPRKSGMGGLGAGGGAALGLGAGLVGGALLTDAFEDHNDGWQEQQAYDQGYDQGYDNGNDGGDMGGGDF